MLRNSAALIVDDVEMNRDILRDMLESEYEILEAGDGEEALSLLLAHQADVAVVLLDLLMPGRDGFFVLKEMKRLGLISQIPVLIISGDANMESEKLCFELGAADFIRKPYQQLLVQLRVKNTAELYRYKNRLESLVESQTRELTEANRKLRQQNDIMTDLLGNVVEARNQESGEHIRRVRSFCQILGNYLVKAHPELGLTEKDVEIIASAGMLHDVGKIMISDAVLLKPGKLSQEEFQLMKTHTVLGCQVLDNAKLAMDGEYVRLAKEICRGHHEKWDGRGYPDGLKGEEIPLSAQIVSVADCYDALTMDRVYKKAFSPQKAFEMIIGGECGAFSPLMQECLEACREEMKPFTEYEESGRNEK